MAKLTAPLQQSLVTLLLMNNQQGRIAAGMVTADMFEHPYADIVSRTLNYHKNYGKAPGREHLDDIFDDILNDPDNRHRQLYENILVGVVEQADGLNADYVLTRIGSFARMQSIKIAITEAGRRYRSEDESLLEDVEGILTKALKPSGELPDSGVFLSSKDALDCVLAPRPFYSLGIKELDAVEFGPARGELMIFMAPKKFGKSWFCIHVGRQALMQQARVVHITLEMSRDEVLKRYFQNFFGVAKRMEKYNATKLTLTDRNKLKDITFETQMPKHAFSEPNIRKFLAQRQTAWGARLGRIVVKEFPSGMLTVPRLNAYLDELELQHGFIPDVLIVDYPRLMKQSSDDLRMSLGQTVVDLRGICRARNLAGVAPSQTNREGWNARTVNDSHIGEDASILMTADSALIGMKTKAEARLNLARLAIAAHRTDASHVSLLIAQGYTTGQFITKVARMDDEYFNILHEYSNEEEIDG